MGGLLSAAEKPLADKKFVWVGSPHVLVKVFFNLLGPIRKHELMLQGFSGLDETDYVWNQPHRPHTGHIRILEAARDEKILQAFAEEEGLREPIFRGRALVPRDNADQTYAIAVSPPPYAGKRVIFRQ